MNKKERMKSINKIVWEVFRQIENYVSMNSGLLSIYMIFLCFAVLTLVLFFVGYYLIVGYLPNFHNIVDLLYGLSGGFFFGIGLYDLVFTKHFKKLIRKYWEIKRNVNKS